VGNPAQRIASAEGRSPSFPGGAFFAVYVPLALVGVWSIRALVTHRSAPGVLLGACAITAIAASARVGNLPWHAIVTALLIAELTKSWLPRWRARRPLLIVGSAVAAGVSVALVAALALRSQAGYEAETPLRATGAAAQLAAAHPCWLILADNLA